VAPGGKVPIIHNTNTKTNIKKKEANLALGTKVHPKKMPRIKIPNVNKKTTMTFKLPAAILVNCTKMEKMTNCEVHNRHLKLDTERYCQLCGDSSNVKFAYALLRNRAIPSRISTGK
jgi:hypothetical protein